MIASLDRRRPIAALKQPCDLFSLPKRAAASSAAIQLLVAPPAPTRLAATSAVPTTNPTRVFRAKKDMVTPAMDVKSGEMDENERVLFGSYR